MEVETFSENCSLIEENGRVGTIGEGGYYRETVNEERADKVL